MFEDAAEQLIERVEQVKREKEFLPTINKYCRNCDYLEICPKAGQIKEMIAQDNLPT